MKKILTTMFMALLMVAPTISAADISLQDLTSNQQIADFKVKCVYENENGMIMGAQFRHIQSGFVLDMLRIQSVPQAFMWVNSIPPSDQGEPHTCEHLLLGKGTKGRYVASLEDMSIGRSSAYTRQLETCYFFNTGAGSDVFFNLFEQKLDAMLNPTFSDEEIRREVCNFGYSVDPTDSSLRLEEKGTVYAEMISGYERPWGNLWRKLDQLTYGIGHPMSLDAGGYPPAIRTMTAADMRAFHSSTHHLNNMASIVAIPDELSLEECLQNFSDIFKRVEPDAVLGDDPAMLWERLPSPNPAPTGTIELVKFPHQNENEPGSFVFVWPPVLELETTEENLLGLFMDNIASGQTSLLYERFINSQTQTMDIGATSVWGSVNDHPGHAIYVGFGNVKREALTEQMLDSVRTVIMNEIAAVAAYPDGSDELKEFNERALNSLIGQRRGLARFLNSPPRFGSRGTSSRWMDHLRELNESHDFSRSLMMTDIFANMEAELDRDENVWRTLVAGWDLTATKPFAVASVPDPELLAKSEQERKERIAAFTSGLMTKYGVTTETEAIALYKAEYDSATAVIEEEAKTIEMPGFVKNPPMTLDDQLQYSVDELPGGGPMVTSTFDNISSSTVGLAFDMYALPESLLTYASLLPTMLTEVGVMMNDQPVAYDEMIQSIRREILGLDAYYDVNTRTERVELVVRAAAGNVEESKRAIEWLSAVLFDPDWRSDNLPRIRDAVDQSLSRMRNRMQGSEESWVNDPANAWWRQDNKLMMSANSFLTRTHSTHRLRWLFKSVDSDDALKQVKQFTDELKKALSYLSREQLTETFPKLAEGNSLLTYPDGKVTVTPDVITEVQAQEIVAAMVKDLTSSLSDVPDVSLGDDLAYLCDQMVSDLVTSPEIALDGFSAAMDLLRNQNNVRGFMIANSTDGPEIRSMVDGLVSRLSDSPVTRHEYSTDGAITERILQRTPESDITYVGLVNNNTRSGVHINTVDCAAFTQSSEDRLLDFLTARLYGGGGAHSMFMKTWGAGLAYSNGLRSNEVTGRLMYYAERCPELSQTMQFVVDQLKNAPFDTSLSDYAVAQAFAVLRSASDYEDRGESMAADLADGLTPEVVTAFREGVLALRAQGGLYEKLHARMERVYGQVLPGYGPVADNNPGALYFVIGPEGQIESYEKYLKSVEGEQATITRLYPRDYWIPRK